MSSLGSPNPFFIAGKKAYEIERSLRFNDNDTAYLTRTPSSAGNRKIWTLSVWVKRTTVDANQRIFTAYDGSNNNAECSVQFQSDGKIQINNNNTSSNTDTNLKTDRLFRDPSAWYHIVVATDMTQGTAANRVNLYINGEQETSFSTESYGTQDVSWWFANNSPQTIGRRPTSERYFDGYMTEFNFIDGLQLTPSSFGATNAVTGQWNPKKYTGSYGTNGFYLNFSDNSGTTATTLGKDSSGNGNNFTPNNFSVSAGAGNDSLEDTPTNNFCTMNPLVPSPSVTWANGNLDLGGSSSSEYNQTNTSTFGVSSGKWYAEVKVTYSTTNVYVGICPITTSPTTNLTNNVTDGAVLRMDNTLFIEGSSPSSGTSISSGNTIGIALDMDNQKVWFSVQGTYLSSGNPATGANATFDGITAGETIAICARPLNGTLNFNFGQRAFSYTPPTGFEKLNSANLPDPTIKKPNQHFNTILWTGNSTNGRTLTGVGFAPDLTWIKCRSDVVDHLLDDTVRGANKVLSSNSTAAESSNSQYGYLSAFASDGFTLTQGTNGTHPMGSVNHSGRTYAAWNWNAGGSTVTNNDGSVASQVRANTSAGFSLLTYTGTGSNATIGHGLGVAPDAIFVKRRNGTQNWGVYHSSIAPNDILQLDVTNSVYGGSGVFGNALATSSVFSVNAGSGMSNGNGDTYVAYCFSSVAGYSKFGKYTGNQNADGTFVFTGFRPALVITKGTWGGNWNMYDNSRNSFNVANKTLYPNLSNAESTESSSGNQMDLLSNGFKLRGSNNDTNHAADFVYLAFAESPFKNARAR